MAGDEIALRLEPAVVPGRQEPMNHIDTKISAASPFTLYGVELSSRLLLGTARYPSPQAMSEAVKASRVSARHRVGASRAGQGQHGRSASST